MLAPNVNNIMKVSDRNSSLVKLFHCVFAVLAISMINKGFVDAEANKSLSNVALFKDAFQSSQFDNSSSPDLAVDDNVTTCSVTAKQKLASWTLDLGKVYPISHMKINTGGTYFGQNFEISVGQIYSQDGGRELCNIGKCDNEDECVMSCFGGPVMAGVVTITNKYASGVTLCDVQVLVCEDYFFGLHCKMQCHCNDNEVCDKLNGKCPHLCAPGFNGTDCQSVCTVGYFGPSCNKQCHCLNSSDCNKQTGDCPGSCADGWVGPGCQTKTPTLVAAPSMFSADVTEIKIVWQSWISYVDPSITLLYQIQYKLSSDTHRDNQSWAAGPLAPDKDAFNEDATVTGLQRNSFYVFRVIPILRLSSSEQIYGVASPESTPFRTKCSVPETPNITAAYALLDASRQHMPLAVLCVEWTPLTPKQSNCENILYYEICYQNTAEDKTNWRTVGAKSTEHAKNISFDISFSTEYEVKVVVHNNHPYQSISDTKVVVTPARPPIPAPSTVQSVVIIVAVVICAGVLLSLFLAFLIYRHKMRTEYVKMKRPFGMKSGSSVECMIAHSNNVYDDLIHPHHIIFPGDEIPKKKKRVKKRPPIKVEELENYIFTKQENDCEELRKEYRDIPEINNEASMSIGERIDNRQKNRFINIIPYDHSRVVLKEDGDQGSDYINASYIDGYKKPHAYIASQGCTKATTQDFWRMIWEQDSRRIVMVTNLVEKGKIKCEQYWPNKMNEEMHFHDITVMLTDEEKTADFVIRTLEVRRGSEVRNIKQFHYTTWPDHGVPSRAGPIIVFRRKVRSFDESHPGIIVVHCSAGVGRTGAFIALDYLLDQAKAEGQVDIYGLTRLMRKNRGNMIQTVEQYFFVYNALLEALKSGNTVISCSEFHSVYEALCRVDDTTGKSRLQEQFEMLQSLMQSAKADDCLLGQQPENQDKNRYSTILPADRHRPYLMTKVPGTNDYINAVFLDGHCSRNAFIITQMPLPHTVIDLWRMIYEHKCLTIVMLNQRDEQDETYGQYWPEENEECECGPFVVEIVSISRPTPDVVLRKLKLCCNSNPNGSSLMRDAGPRIINHIQLTNWNSEDLVPPSPHSLVSLIDLVEQSQKRAGNSPVVIHCHDGVTQSGLFAAACCIWERLRDDQEIDVFQTVKHLRYYRRQIVEDFTQYKFCYDMVLEYLENFSTYSNFK